MPPKKKVSEEEARRTIEEEMPGFVVIYRKASGTRETEPDSALSSQPAPRNELGLVDSETIGLRISFPLLTGPAKDQIDEVLAKHGEDFRAGDKCALPRAINVCAHNKVALPPWAAEAFIEGFNKAKKLNVISWDEILGCVYKKGRHVDTIRKNLELSHLVYATIKNRRLNGRAIDPNLFDEVGNDFGIGPRLCRELYYIRARRRGEVKPRKKREPRK